MRKKENNQEWKATINALKTTHTLNTKDICKILRASRSWVNTYVLPYLRDDRILLPTGLGAGSGNSTNWVQVAAKDLGRKDFTEIVWYNRQKFDELVARSVGSVTRQTIRLPAELFISDKTGFRQAYDAFVEKEKSLLKELDCDENKKFNELLHVNSKQEKLWHSWVDENLAGILSEGQCSFNRKTSIPVVDLSLDAAAHRDRWIALSDVMDFGDTEVQKLREFFKKGCLHIEMDFHSVEGKKCRKVFYMPDLQPIKHRYVDQYLTFSYSVWLEYRNVIAGVKGNSEIF